MRKIISLAVSAIFCVAVLCAVLLASPQNENFKNADKDITVYNTPVATAPVNEIAEAQSVETYEATVEVEGEEPLTEDDFGARFVNMLNINYCYGDSFNDMQKMVDASAVTLRDYSADVLGFGLCVNDILVEGFAQSFYGVSVELDGRARNVSPKGYVLVPEVEVATQYHELVSFTETDGVFEVVTSLTFYYGGDDVETCVSVSRFVRNTESEFGFNLLSCTVF